MDRLRLPARASALSSFFDRVVVIHHIQNAVVIAAGRAIILNVRDIILAPAMHALNPVKCAISALNLTEETSAAHAALLCHSQSAQFAAAYAQSARTNISSSIITRFRIVVHMDRFVGTDLCAGFRTERSAQYSPEAGRGGVRRAALPHEAGQSGRRSCPPRA